MSCVTLKSYKSHQIKEVSWVILWYCDTDESFWIDCASHSSVGLLHSAVARPEKAEMRFQASRASLYHRNSGFWIPSHSPNSASWWCRLSEKLRMVLAQRCQDGGRGDSWDTSGAARCLFDLSRENSRHDCHSGHLPGLQSHGRRCHMCLPFSNRILDVPCAKDGRGGCRRRGLFLKINFSISAGSVTLLLMTSCYLLPSGRRLMPKRLQQRRHSQFGRESPKKPFSSNKKIGKNHPLRFVDTQWRNGNVRLIDGQLPLPPRYHTNPANPKDAGEEAAEAAAEEAGRPLLRSDRRTCCIAHHFRSISDFDCLKFQIGTAESFRICQWRSLCQNNRQSLPHWLRQTFWCASYPPKCLNSDVSCSFCRVCEH